jgi:hypothetical protein
MPESTSMMLASVSALDVAFVSGIAAVTGSLAGPLISFLSARGDRVHQRQLSREERSFDARRTVYEDTLAEIAKDLVNARQHLARVRRGRAEITTRDENELDDVTVEELGRTRGRLATIASEEVMEAFEELTQAAVDFWTAMVAVVVDGTPGDYAPAERADELAPLLTALLERRVALERKVRRDLLVGLCDATNSTRLTPEYLCALRIGLVERHRIGLARLLHRRVRDAAIAHDWHVSLRSGR